MSSTTFNYTGAIVQTYTVTVTGTYDITAYGAQGGQGGNPNGGSGGLGAEIGGELFLTQGEVLQIVVGGAGGFGGGGGGGGGGGTFVIETYNGTNAVHIPLVIAGGGGGGAFNNNLPNFLGDAGQTGTSGSSGRYGGGAGGTGGAGGASGGHYGGGGGGYSGGNGASGYSGGGSTSGTSGSGYGGGYGGGGGNYGSGGFGGGGGGGYDGGGGGGYSGGGGGYAGFGFYGGGGGGGSLDTGTFLVAVAGEHAGNGMVAIEDITPCYCPGTLILTPDGEVPVEELQIGDEIVTLSGAARTIEWIGRRSYSGQFVLGREDILPICITAGAIEDGIPRRDLWVSPNHALYLEDVLIEAKDVVNGVSIYQAEAVDSVAYFHLELASHDVIFAEGAAAESFIDDDNRGLFHNAAEYWRAHPDEVAAPAQYCAPRQEEGFAVGRARARINDRAGLPVATETADIGALRGHIDGIGRRVTGWARDEACPEAPVCLDIYAGNERIGQALANRYRADLESAGSVMAATASNSCRQRGWLSRPAR
jgi:hypothetical protein